MALKCFPRESTSLYSFLKEYNFSLSFCTHPSLTSALGIAYFTPSHYIFAQQAGLYGDLYNVILPEVQCQVNSRLRDLMSSPSAFGYLAGLITFHSVTSVHSSQVGMEEDCCQRVVSQLCSALSHLHSLGFVHRDLKPENVFLCDATCHWVKLGDYGMVSATCFYSTTDPCDYGFYANSRYLPFPSPGEGQGHQSPGGLVQLTLLHPRG